MAKNEEMEEGKLECGPVYCIIQSVCHKQEVDSPSVSTNIISINTQLYFKECRLEATLIANAGYLFNAQYLRLFEKRPFPEPEYQCIEHFSYVPARDQQPNIVFQVRKAKSVYFSSSSGIWLDQVCDCRKRACVEFEGLLSSSPLRRFWSKGREHQKGRGVTRWCNETWFNHFWSVIKVRYRQ